MKANSKRKVFGDAVDLLMGDMEEVTMPRGVQMLPVKGIQPFHDHPFHLYEGERLEDMIASVKEHGVLNPVIVQKLDSGYEMLSGHNRWNAAKLAGLKEIPAIVKTDLSEEEAYVYVIETNLMQRSFSDLAISEKAAVLKATLPDVVEAAIQAYREDNDWLGQFLEECCEIDPSYKEKSGELYQAYRAHCMQNGEYIRSTTDFYSSMDKAGYNRIRKNTGVQVVGLKLKEGQDFLE